ncbi:MAG: ATPase [Gammaproteobacteria bacterium]|nr:ATPase [Gammaproteobacteria bacterium]
MTLRPAPARWFELLTARDDLTVALETLAKTRAVELEIYSETATRMTIPDLHGRMEDYSRLAQRYQQYWPMDDIRPSALPGRPTHAMDDALKQLHAWCDQADSQIQRLETLRAERTELRLVNEMLSHYGDAALNLVLMAKAGPALAARLYVLAPRTHASQVPAGVITQAITTRLHEFLLVLGPPKEINDLDQELAALKGRQLDFPTWLRGNLAENRDQVSQRLAEIDRQTRQLQRDIDTLAEKHQLREALGNISQLDWVLTHVVNLPVTENLAWVSGWSSDLTGRTLDSALKRADVRALLRFPPPPKDKTPPMVMHNPWWARPFELFAQLLGTPAREEADPSRLLAIIVPLLFGYMFGDVGQGLVLLVAGVTLQRRWPLLRLLISAGFSSMVFGVVFGSVFSREDIIAPLWVHPLEHPLPVLTVPLFGGIGILLLGLLLNALEAYWRRDMRTWIHVDAAVLTLYLGTATSILHFTLGVTVAMAGLLWYLNGSLWQARTGGASFTSAITRLLESMMQLVINTISFARVGAFALAHAGLSLAIVAVADASGHPVPTFLIMLLGNMVIIILEGLVVSVQTTRLVLFEFFVRFLKGEGRVFHPLSMPPSSGHT